MLDNKKKFGLATKAIHSGQEPDKTTGAIMVPIYASSTYVQESPANIKVMSIRELKTLPEQPMKNVLQI